jgi:signal transduction histidine kinase
MNSTRNFFIALLTMLFLAGCEQTGHHLTSQLTQSQQAVLSDSLLKLDSLVLQNRAIKFSESLKYAKRANEIAKKLNTHDAFVKSFIMLGNVYYSSKMDSGFYFYNKALLLIDSFQLAKERGKVLYDLGMLYSVANNYKKSILLLDSSLVCSRSIHDFATISNSLNSLGNIYLDIGEGMKARKMYDSAFEVAKSKSLYLQMGTALGNLAKFESDPKKSIELDKRAVSYLQMSNGSNEPVASILINIGNRFPNPDSAIYYFTHALQLISVENDPLIVIGANNSMAYSYLDKGDVTNAEKCIDHALSISININNPDWQSTIFDTYSDIMARKGNLSQALKYEKKSMEAMDIANKQSALKQVRLLVAMLDLKNMETIIKDEKNEIEQANAHLRNKRLWIAIFILVVFILSGVLIFLVQKKRIQLQHQQIESAKKIIDAEENEKAKIGKDFHDITGQKFSSFSGYIENMEFPDDHSKSTILSLVQDLKETVRDMSHRMNRTWLERFTLAQSIHGLCNDIVKMTHLNLEFQAPDEYPAIPKETNIHIFRIIQELLSNAVKHAPRSKVELDISFSTDYLILTYNDDGPGFSKEKDNNGVGLCNLFERIKLLKGRIELNTTPGFGTYYSIKIPLA